MNKGPPHNMTDAIITGANQYISSTFAELHVLNVPLEWTVSENVLLLLEAYLGKTSPKNSPISLNSLFPEDSTDSDEDLAE